MLEALWRLSEREWLATATQTGPVFRPGTESGLYWAASPLPIHRGVSVRPFNADMAWSVYGAIYAFSARSIQHETLYDVRIHGTLAVVGVIKISPQGSESPSNSTLETGQAMAWSNFPFQVIVHMYGPDLVYTAVYESVAYAMLWLSQWDSLSDLRVPFQILGPSRYLVFEFMTYLQQGEFLQYGYAVKILQSLLEDMQRRNVFKQAQLSLQTNQGAIFAKIVMRRGSSDVGATLAGDREIAKMD